MEKYQFGFGCMRLPVTNADDPASFDYPLIEADCDPSVFRTVQQHREDGGKLRKRRSRHNNVKKYGRCKTHRRAHDGNSAGLTQKPAYVRIVLFRITVSCGERSPDPVSPETGKQKDKHSHVESFDQRVQKDDICHIAESAGCQIDSFPDGDIVDLHPVCHGIGHDDPENDSLCSVFWHLYLLLSTLTKIGVCETPEPA